MNKFLTILTSFQLRHRYYVIKNRDETNVIRFFHFGPERPTQSKFLATRVLHNDKLYTLTCYARFPFLPIETTYIQ